MIIKAKLKEIIISQKKYLKILELGTEREKNTKINNSFATIITGIRRCGKSTYLRQILKKEKKAYYLNLEDPRLEGFEVTDFDKVEKLMEEIYGSKGTYFFDEIQTIPKWEKFIRYLVDKKEKVVLTGSNASILSKELGTKLTGRYLRQEMFPFSYKEYLHNKQQKPSIKTFEKYLETGGFPEYVKESNPLILNELFSDIITKDIIVRHNIKNTKTLKQLTIHLITNTGKETTYNSLKKMLEVKSVQSIIEYIQYLEDTYLIFQIPKFSYSYKKQQMNPKKIYSIDNGFSTINSIAFSKNKGRMLENLVFVNLRKKHKDIYYYQKNKECDFIIKEKQKIIKAIQVCTEINEDNKNREIQGLLEALNEFKLNKGTIYTNNQTDTYKIEGKTIELKPVWKWLAE